MSIFYTFSFIIGACIGSFLNVCIYRLPKELSIIHPRSQCPSCASTIRWFDNIPILSILWLKFSCRHCQSHISLRYPLVEFLTGVLTVLLMWGYFSGQHHLSYIFIGALCCYALIVITFIDIDYMIIPNEITLSGIILGLILSPLCPQNLGALTPGEGLIQSVLGILVGGGILLIIGTVAEWWLKKEAMGMGDVKLMAMLGALFGWKAALITIFLGSLIGAIIGGLLMLIGRLEKGRHIPFGPYLAMAGFISILWADQMIEWYLHLIGIK